jgi:uncharacterized membrane protein
MLSGLGFMPWNTVLAISPALLAFLLLKRSDQPRHHSATIVFALRFGIILLFLPNAPYVATDLVHFLDTVRGTTVSPWKLLATQVPVYTAYVLIGLLSYGFTEDRLLRALHARLGRRAEVMGLVLLPLLSALGVYLGRVARFNSWDIFQQPVIIARSGGRAMGNLRTLEVIVTIAILLAAVHQLYRIFHDGLRYRRRARIS